MTKEALQEILHVLELDYEAEPTMVYVFYATPDGRVNNFSISMRRGREASLGSSRGPPSASRGSSSPAAGFGSSAGLLCPPRSQPVTRYAPWTAYRR